MKNKPKRTPPKTDFEIIVDRMKNIDMRIMVKSILHDLESTKRENEYLTRLLEKQ